MQKTNARKILLTLLLGIVIVCCHAQSKKNNTHIDTAGRVYIKGGTTTILKADTVNVTIITDPTIPTDVYLLGTGSVVDSNGVYSTVFKFGPKAIAREFSMYVTIEFDPPYIPAWTVDPLPPPNTLVPGRKNHVVDIWGDNGNPRLEPVLYANYKKIILRGVVDADNLYLVVKSKEKLNATIAGVVGKLN